MTIEVMTADEQVLDAGRFDTDISGLKAMTDFAKRWPDRVWAIEGCHGIGRHVAMRLIADSEAVVDVPPKLSARAGRDAGPTPPMRTPSRRSDSDQVHSLRSMTVSP